MFREFGGPQQRKWIIIGGGYAGALAAWFKSKYPLQVIGAWSSSGVIKAVEDFREYDQAIYESVHDD